MDGFIATQARVRAEAEAQASEMSDFAGWLGSMRAKEATRRHGGAAPPRTTPLRSAGAPVRGGAPAAAPTPLAAVAASGVASAGGPADTGAHGGAARHTYDKGYARWDAFDVVSRCGCL